MDLVVKVKERSTSSNGSESSNNLNPETLDELYKNQLHILRELILKLNNTDDIEICRKWLKIFTKIAEDEKFARNCLCTLMQEQLEHFGYLTEPFTDLTNCNRQLEHVLRDIDIECSHSFFSEEEPKTYASHQYVNESDAEKSSIYLQEWQENEILAENAQLKREICALRLKLTEKQIENVKLQEHGEAMDRINREKNNNDIKIFLGHAMCEICADMDSKPNKFPENIFRRVFHDFKEKDQEFYKNVTLFGDAYETLLLKWIDKQIDDSRSTLAKRFYKKYNRTKLRLKSKYERRLKVTNWAQLLQLKLVKIKCYSTLRNIFINLEKCGGDGGGKSDADLWAILRKLEEKYQSVVNEII